LAVAAQAGAYFSSTVLPSRSFQDLQVASSLHWLKKTIRVKVAPVKLPPSAVGPALA